MGGAWACLPEFATRDETYEALDKVDVVQAGELLILPAKATQEFLPDEDDFELRIGRMMHYIRSAEGLGTFIYLEVARYVSPWKDAY